MLNIERLTDLVLGELGLSSSSYQGYVVGSPEHFCCTDARVEVCPSSVSIPDYVTVAGAVSYPETP